MDETHQCTAGNLSDIYPSALPDLFPSTTYSNYHRSPIFSLNFSPGT